MANQRILDELKLWDRNYNKGDVQQIKKSIRRFGFNNAVRVWREGMVIAGNHSTIALRELQAEKWIPQGGAIRVVDERWEVDTIDVSHLSKPEAEAFAIADNHIASMAEPDNAVLAELFSDLKGVDMDIFGDIGYSIEDVDLLFDSLTPATKDEWASALGGLATGDRAPFQQMTFTLHDQQADQVNRALVTAKDMGAYIDSLNENSNGNSLARVCELFITWAGERG